MDPMSLLAQWGLTLVFFSVLLEQAGLPVPAPPILVGAGALAQDGTMSAELVLAAGVGAALLADHAWFIAGRRKGRALLAMLCRVSISPDTCVRKTDDLIGRHGAPLLLVAKFVPGVSAVAIPTGAAMGIPYRRFISFDAPGALIWCGTYVFAGMVFSREVHLLLDWMSRVGGWSLAVLGAAFGLYIAFKLYRRWRLRRLYRLVRISPDEMAALMAAEPELLIVDARSRLARQSDTRRFPNAIEFEEGDVAALVPRGSTDRTIVTFCTCPNEASAAMLAERLLRAGFTRVRVLAGGEAAMRALAREPAAG
jgi:membrane protein DedA with SNARE-associated domain/rhodanese-related sulfurtransferase